MGSMQPPPPTYARHSLSLLDDGAQSLTAPAKLTLSRGLLVRVVIEREFGVSVQEFAAKICCNERGARLSGDCRVRLLITGQGFKSPP